MDYYRGDSSIRLMIIHGFVLEAWIPEEGDVTRAGCSLVHDDAVRFERSVM
jgi:hypothetical protein